MQDRAFEIMAKNEQIGNRIELESQLLELTLSLTTDWRKEHTNVPVFLYHYTNAAGLNGIISSNRMWATNISYLNDSSEILYASELIKQTLEESEHKNDLNIVKEFLIRAQRTFNPFDSFLSAYVVCFCEEEDLLSQWRAYGSQGGGYAIGLESKYVGLRESPNFVLRKVIYKKVDQKRLIEDRITQICELLIKVCQNRKEQDATHVIAVFCEHLRFLFTEMLCCFKNPSFAEEKEWRAAYIMFKDFEEDGTQLQFRISGGSLIPFLDLDLSPSEGLFSGKLPIARIVHGPPLHPEPTKKSLELLLRKHGYVFVDVVGSSIPLRI